MFVIFKAMKIAMENFSQFASVIVRKLICKLRDEGNAEVERKGEVEFYDKKFFCLDFMIVFRP